MIEARKLANVIENSRKALEYEQNVKPYLEDIRYHIDKLELVVDNELAIAKIPRAVILARFDYLA